MFIKLTFCVRDIFPIMDLPLNPPSAPPPISRSSNTPINNPDRSQNNITSTSLLRNRGGIERNNLNNFVQLYLDSEENETFPLSFYHDLETIETELIPFKNEFIILSLNIESLSAKIDKLREIIHILHEKEIDISAIALQETWLSNKADIVLIQIEGYHEPISQGYICGKRWPSCICPW